MHFHSSLRPRRCVWLGYCMNLHAPEDTQDLLGGMEAVTVPLRDRLGVKGQFGIGMYLPAKLARTLATDAAQREEVGAFLREERLVPFTFNAFPYGGFQSDGLKREVFRPTWADEERLAYTRDVAHVAAAWHAATAPRVPGRNDGHVSISTHTGAFGAWLTDRSLLRRCAEGFGRAVGELTAIEGGGGPRIILSLEAEPRASAGTSRALAEFMVMARSVAARVLVDEFRRSEETAARLVDRHLGACLDACHAAVEFESAEEALRLAHLEGPLGKLQVSSALALRRPGSNPAAVASLLALDEPRFLHQATARAGSGYLRVDDLGDLADALAGPEGAAWLAADEWRCHFHVPVDRAELAGGLSTTRDEADQLVQLVATDVGHWHAHELHLEIETYTWSVLPPSLGGAAPGSHALVDGLEREYRHVISRLERAGWDRDGSPLENVEKQPRMAP